MQFTLPALTYEFNALEPFIDALTMEIHHDRHHQTYVTNLNIALENYKDTELTYTSLEDLLAQVDTLPEQIKNAVRNNGGGHWNHSFFWEILSAEKQDGSQMKELADAINTSFEDYHTFREEWKKAALARFGSGWVWLVKGDNGKLEIMTTPNQDNPLMVGKVPVLGLDVWEHAYYLKYQNKRADYVDAFWNAVNWKKVEELLG